MEIQELRAILDEYDDDTEIQINVSDDNMTTGTLVISQDEEYDKTDLLVLSVVLNQNVYMTEENSCITGAC